MMGANTAVGGTKRDAAGRAVGDKQTVERVTGPVESQSMANNGRQRDVVDHESCVVHHCIGEVRVTNRQAADLSEKLDLQEGNRRDAPWAIPIQPWKFSKAFRAENEPDQKVGIEKKGHRTDRRRETRPRSGPRHSQDHRSAFSASGTRRSRLYCRAPLAFRELANFLPAQHDPVPFALYCDYLAPEGLVEETEPVFPGFRCGHILHMYNVQE